MTRNRFKCLDCRIDTGKAYEYYFVNTELWMEATGSERGMLCIGCLERRIGRQLTPMDFTGAWINNPMAFPMSDRLRSRILGG